MKLKKKVIIVQPIHEKGKELVEDSNMHRELIGTYKIGVKILSLFFSILILYTAAFGVLPHMQQRAIVVFLGLALNFAMVPFRKNISIEKKIPWYDLLLIMLAGLTCLNIAFRYKYYIRSCFGVYSNFEYILGIILIVLVLEATRRSIGLVFIFLNFSIILYCLFGHYIPGYWGHGLISYQLLLQYLYQSDLGIWGTITGVIASLVSIFILFGVMLQYTGGGDTFIELSKSLAGKFKGGPALVAVIASAFFGSISGSTVANVATTGNFTIPMMKKLGYKPEFAGGVEAAASTGGNLMPPIMGSGAFIMSELLGIPYISICAAAFIPAVLYFSCVLFQVIFEAAKLNLKAIPKSEIPNLKDIMKWKYISPLFIPVIVLIFFLFRGYDPYRACFYAFFIAVILYVFSNINFEEVKYRLKNIYMSLEKGIDSLANIIALIVSAQIFVSLVELSSLGTKFSELIMSIGGKNMFACLVLSGILSLFLGMSLPTTAAYLIAASVVAPTLIMLGVDALSAHLFVFYFAIISALTPPVCIAAFTAAIIAKADWLKIAMVAMKLSIVSYIIPFLLVYNQAFLLKGDFVEIIITVLKAYIGILFICSGMIGYFNRRINILVRLSFIVGGFFFFITRIGISLLAIPIILIGLGIIYIPSNFLNK